MTTSLRSRWAAVGPLLGCLPLLSCNATDTLSESPPAKILTIGAIQGRVADHANGLKHKSPRNKEEVTVQGVVTARLLWTSRKGHVHHAFTLQNTVDEADGDPLTSDAIFVYTERVPTLRFGRENILPNVGDCLCLAGIVGEYFGQTQLTEPRLIEKRGRVLDMDTVVPAIELHPPEEDAKKSVFWERLECMRVSIPAGAVVTGARHENRRNGNTMVHVIRGDHPVAQREDARTRRVYRDAHPLDDTPHKLFDNGNGFRIILDALALRGEAQHPKMQLPAVRTLDVITNRLTGVVLHGEDGHTVAVRNLPEIQPSDVLFPEAERLEGSIRVATYNVENLFDYRNDPTDDSDFHGDSGTSKTIGGIFDYVPDSEEGYQARQVQIAGQIIHELKVPDILMIQEAEDQDLCIVKDGKIVYTGKNNADGRPDVLQDLALEIQAQGGPEYLAVADRDGADARGIICAYLYRPDRVRLVPQSDLPPLFTDKPGIEYPNELLPYSLDTSNPKVFNAHYQVVDRNDRDGDVLYTRGPMAAAFEIYPERVGEGTATTLFLLNNHFASRPDRKIDRRTHQARFLAACAKAILDQRPGALLIAGGDLNVFARPDDPVEEKPSDQLRALYEMGLINAYDAILAEDPIWAYSYVYAGQAGLLDHMFLSPELAARRLHAQYLHINTDFSEPAHSPRHVGASDHDPLIIQFRGAP